MAEVKHGNIIISRTGLSKVYQPPPDIPVTAILIFVHGLFGHPYHTWATKVAPKRDSTSFDRLGVNNGSSSGVAQLGSVTSTDSSSWTASSTYREKASSCYWPVDLLPQTLKGIQVFTWGHDADVHSFASSAGLNTIHQHATNLLLDLVALKDNPEENPTAPFIFVVHSLGGLIVKDTLNQSASAAEKTKQHIVASTCGVCFLGTPHRGSKSASLGRAAFRMAEIFAFRQTNTPLLRGLEKNSETLDRITDGFNQTLQKYQLLVGSFREEKATRKLGLISVLVVEPDSAKIGYTHEELGSIPSDHRHMAKFKTASDTGFKRVSSLLRRWIDQCSKANVASYRDCLDSLYKKEMGARFQDVDERHPTTFDWVYDDGVVPFSQWLRKPQWSGNTVFWISGKPGSGKSTLMKFIMRDQRTLNHLPTNDESQWKTIGFFFHDRGSNVQKSLNGMLQDILYQMLSHVPSLFQGLRHIYETLAKVQRKTSPEWDLESLKTCLLYLASQKDVWAHFLIFLDALDEHSGDNETLAQLLNDMLSSSRSGLTQLKICVASRPWTVFTSNFRDVPTFAIHEFTRKDIERFTTSKLFQAWSASRATTDKLELVSQYKNLIDTIADKAHGVFIWVKLVVDEICRGFRDGTPLFVLEKLATEMPQALGELYSRTISRIDPDYLTEAHVMLEIALHSRRPLRLETFIACTMYSIWRKVEESSFESMKSKIASRTGGLLEVVVRAGYGDDPHKSDSIPSPDRVQPNYVQFLHQTVKEFVASSAVTSVIVHAQTPVAVKSESGEDPRATQKKGYEHLLECAVYNQDWADPLRRDVFEYAYLVDRDISNGRTGINALDCLHSMKQGDTFLSGLDLEVANAAFYRLLFDQRGHVAVWSRLHCLAIAANLINFPLTSRYNKSKHIEPSGRPCLLQVACLGPKIVQGTVDREKMAQRLLQSGYHADTESYALVLASSLPFNGLQGFESDRVTPLGAHLLSTSNPEIDSSGLLATAKTLLEGKADPNFEIASVRSGRTAMRMIEFAARFLSKEWVQLLSMYGGCWGGSRSKGTKIGTTVPWDVYPLVEREPGLLEILQNHGVGGHEPWPLQESSWPEGVTDRALALIGATSAALVPGVHAALRDRDPYFKGGYTRL